MRISVQKVSKRIVLAATAFVLAVSTLTASVPFFLSERAAAAGDLHTTNLAADGWYLGESKSGGHQELVANGLRVWTTGGPTDGTNRKAAGYHAVTPFPLSQAADADISFASYTGPRPSLQLAVDRDGNGSWDGYLVYEPWDYGTGKFWINKPGFGVPSGAGYASLGTIAEFAIANPDAKVIALGYSLGTLGSHPDGDAVISKITLNGANYTFAAQPPAVPGSLGFANAAQTCGGYTNVNYAQPTWGSVAGAVKYNYEALFNGGVIFSTSYATNQHPGGTFGAGQNGAWGFRVQSVDTNGLVSAWSPVCAVTLDTVSPIVTGFSYSNNNGAALTKDNVIVTMTTSEAIQVPAGWTAQDATHYVRSYDVNDKQTVTVSDYAGNVSVPKMLEVKRIDKNAPIISGVSDGATVRGTVNLSIFDPKDNGMADGFDRLHGLTVNGVEVPTVEGSGKTYLYDIVGDGDYTIVATDKAGNSQTLAFTIDNSITVTFNAINQVSGTPTISGRATHTADGAPLADTQLILSIDNTDRYTVTTNANGEFSSSVFVANGDHVVKLSRNDGSTDTTLGQTRFATIIPTGENAPLNPVTPANFPQAISPVAVAQVLGDSTQVGQDTPANRNVQGAAETKGAATQKQTAQAANSDDNKGIFLGLAWYWWILIIAALALIAWWIIAAIRGRQAE